MKNAFGIAPLPALLAAYWICRLEILSHSYLKVSSCSPSCERGKLWFPNTFKERSSTGAAIAPVLKAMIYDASSLLRLGAMHQRS